MTLCAVRGQHTLAWTWPDQTLVAQELSDRQTQQLTTHAPRERVAVVSECEGQPVRPYCKRLVLRGARAKDTGNYRCYYKDAKSIIDGTTAVSIYAFIRGESCSYSHHSLVYNLVKKKNWINRQF